MSLIYLDSFDSYATDDIEKSWRGDTGLTYFAIRGPAPSDPEYLLRPNSKVLEVNGNYSWQTNKYLMSGERIESILVGYKRRVSDPDGLAIHFPALEVSNRIGAQFTLMVNEDGSISAFRGTFVGTLISTSRPDVVKSNCFQQLEMKVKVHDSTGFWYVRVDGDLVFSGENLDTRSQPTLDGIDRIAIGGQDGDPGVYEDFYVMDLSGEFNSDFIDGARVDCLHPNAPGTNTDWTADSGSNYARVSDGGDVNSASYVASSTDGHVDTYHFEDLEVLSGETTVHGVQVRLFATDDEISGELLPTFYDGTKYNGSGELATWNWSSSWQLTAGKEPYCKTPWVWDRDPGGGAWTESTINSGEFGVELNIP